MDTTKPVGVMPGRANGEAAAFEERSGPPAALRPILIAVIVIGLVVAVLAGVRFLAYATSHESTDDAIIDADQVQITSKISERVRAILVDTNQRVYKGQLIVQLDDTDETHRLAQARAAVDAQRAQARAAQENVSLTRDTQVAQDVQGRGGIAQARANISSFSAQTQSAQQQIDVAVAGVNSARAQLQAAQAGVPGALENERKAQADLKRAASLVKTGDVAAAQLDAARAAYESTLSSYQQAQANVAAAQANLDSAQQKLDAQRYSTDSAEALIGVQRASLQTAQGKFEESSAPSRVAAAQAQADAAYAQLESLQAQLSTALDQLSYTKIRSPIDGYVGQKNVEIGATVAPGQSLMTIVPNANIFITANFKETQIGRMHVGDPVDINVDAYPHVLFHGHVQNLSPASQNTFSLVPAQNATGNFVKVTQRLPVRIVFDNPPAQYPLRPGLSVEPSVKVK
jgi:membrane fusion protein (multidrug efflux system)